MTENHLPSPHNSNPDGLPFSKPHFPNHILPAPIEGSRNSQQSDAPTSPPPTTVPKFQNEKLSVDPGALRGCLYRDTFIKLANRSSFWFHPTYIDYDTTSGFKWNGYAWIPWGNRSR